MDKELERMERYQKLNEKLQRLYASPESGRELSLIFAQHQLQEALYPIYAEIIGDTILGYHRLSDIPRLLQQRMKLSADESQRVTSKLLDFLSPVVRREEEERKAKTSEYQQLAQKVAEVRPTDESLPVESVEPLRTMETDIHRVHGYGSYNSQYQSTLEDEGEKPQ